MKKSIKLEAPDGGFGFFVCIGMAMPFISILGSFPSFGLIFGDFLKSIGAETSAIAFITSSFFCSLSLAGLFANSLFKRFSIRTVGICGGILFFMGSVMQAYVKTTIELTVAYSLLQGIAAGLIIPCGYTTFNSYFVKKRVMVMAFTQTLIGVGTMFYPVVVQKLYEWYGFRGSLLVLAAINSHAILGMLCMHPVEWHMKRAEVSDDDDKIAEDHKDSFLDPEERDSLDIQTNKNLSSKMGSYVSLKQFDEPIVLNDALTEMQTPTKKASCLQGIADFLDLSLLKDPIYLNIVLGMSFVLYSDHGFFTLQPMYLFELNFSKVDTADIIAIMAGSDVISRVIIALSAFFVTIPSRYIYLAGTFFTFITRFAFVEVFDFTKMAIVNGIMGFFRAWIYVTIPLVYGEFLPSDRYASGFGLFMFLQGNLTFLMGPIVGYIRDRTNNYVIAFHCMNFFLGLCAITWIIEILYRKCRKNKKSTDYEIKINK